MSPQGERGKQGDHGQRGETGARGPRGLRAPGIVNALVIFFLLFSSITTYMGYRINQNTQKANEAARRAEVFQYQSCSQYNRAFARFNILIESAIAEERAKPHPDKKRIQNLINFRHPIRDCGRKP